MKIECTEDMVSYRHLWWWNATLSNKDIKKFDILTVLSRSVFQRLRIQGVEKQLIKIPLHLYSRTDAQWLLDHLDDVVEKNRNDDSDTKRDEGINLENNSINPYQTPGS